jgi:hypothetical protein
MLLVRVRNLVLLDQMAWEDRRRLRLGTVRTVPVSLDPVSGHGFGGQ